MSRLTKISNQISTTLGTLSALCCVPLSLSLALRLLPLQISTTTTTYSDVSTTKRERRDRNTKNTPPLSLSLSLRVVVFPGKKTRRPLRLPAYTRWCWSTTTLFFLGFLSSQKRGRAVLLPSSRTPHANKQTLSLSLSEDEAGSRVLPKEKKKEKKKQSMKTLNNTTKNPKHLP